MHLFCRAFGIESPKEEFSGDQVGELFAQKKFLDIARYNVGDLVSKTKLYKIWQEFLKA